MSLRFLFVTQLIVSGLLANTTLFYNAKIHTFDKKNSIADWMAVKDGAIAAVGNAKIDPQWKDAKRVNLQGNVVVPGLTDAHFHLVHTGKKAYEVDLRGSKSAKAAVAKVRQFIKQKKLSNAPVIVGHGWDQSDWKNAKFPTRQMLDVVSKKPIVLYRIDGHAAWVNTSALKAAKLWKTKKNPKGGKLIRNKLGTPTGVLIDTAMNRLAYLFPKPTIEDLQKYIQSAVQQAVSHGITSIHDAGAGLKEIQAIRRLLREQRVHFRFYEMISARSFRDIEYYLSAGPEVNGENGQLSVRAMKIHLDGAMGSRGAAFDEPYNDDKKNKGLLKYSPKELTDLIRKIDKKGFQVAVHAIGSRANHIAINAIESALGKSAKSKRPRLEHAQVLKKSDLPRIAKLGIVASMQPTHCTSDMKWVVKRIGKQRSQFAYAWKSLLDLGVPLAFGSDSPVEHLNPWNGLYAAEVRTDSEGRTLNSNEKISRLRAFQSFTKAASYASFSEKKLGSLEPGKWADFVELKSDPMLVSVERLKKTQVLATYIGGNKVYSLETGLP